MWQMITLFLPDEPPQVSHDSFRKPDMHNVVTDHKYWTYGGLMLRSINETSSHDPVLLQVVCWCMGESGLGPSRNSTSFPIVDGDLSCLTMESVVAQQLQFKFTDHVSS